MLRKNGTCTARARPEAASTAASWPGRVHGTSNTETSGVLKGRCDRRPGSIEDAIWAQRISRYDGKLEDSANSRHLSPDMVYPRRSIQAGVGSWAGRGRKLAKQRNNGFANTTWSDPMGRSAGVRLKCSLNTGNSRTGKQLDLQAKSLTQRLVPFFWACQHGCQAHGESDLSKFDMDLSCAPTMLPYKLLDEGSHFGRSVRPFRTALRDPFPTRTENPCDGTGPRCRV